MGTVSKVERLLPADKGNVQDNDAKFEAYKAKTDAELAEDKQEINALISKVNSLTPVGSFSKHVSSCHHACVPDILNRCYTQSIQQGHSP